MDKIRDQWFLFLLTAFQQLQGAKHYSLHETIVLSGPNDFAWDGSERNIV